MPPNLADALLAYAYFVAIIATAAMLAIEAALCRGAIDLARARLLGRYDIGYFACAILVLASGLARVFRGIKGAAFYLGNPVFHLKVGLFVLVGLLSIVPTLRFIGWRKRLAAGGDVGADQAALAARWV
jgi:putative membrane protein